MRTYVASYVDLHCRDDTISSGDPERLRFWELLTIESISSGSHNGVNFRVPVLDSVDTLADVIATFIVTVTGFHQHVGNVSNSV